MTLVITELSEFGIAMVADSAVTCEEKTPAGDTIRRVLNGANKLQPISYLGAGISMWGLGSIKTSVGPVSTDVWIADFIQRQIHVKSIDEFAKQLAQELQRVVSNVKIPMGFHLAGYVEKQGTTLPTFYHVRNVEGTYLNYDYHDFIPGQDFPPREMKKGGEPYRTRNGDYAPYAILAWGMENMLPTIRKSVGISIPYASIQGRIAYLTAWLRFVSDLYASSGLLRTIGGNILSIGITPEKQVLCYSM
jgi:hypothetical protein